VADVESIKAAVRQDDTLSLALQLTDSVSDKFTRMNFRLGGPHNN
jgi:hypothetical protein